MSQANSDQLLNECRQLMTQRMRKSLSGMMRKVDDVLFDLAFQQGGNVTESPYFEAVREINLRRKELEIRFERRFAALFEESLRSGLGDTDSPRSLTSMTPDLGAGCREALLMLDTRVRRLLVEKKGGGRNPMAPELVFAAFRDASNDISKAEDVRRTLYELFEKHVGAELESIYRELDNVLAVAGHEQPGSANDAGRPESLASNETGSVQLDRPVLQRYWVTAKIERLLGQHTVPFFVRAFLLRHWRLLLESILELRGEQSSDWKRTMQTAEDLIRSVQIPADAEERRRLIWLLPGLIYRLKMGMRVLEMPVADQKLFLKTLKLRHLHLHKRKEIPAGALLDDSVGDCATPATRHLYSYQPVAADDGITPVSNGVDDKKP